MSWRDNLPEASSGSEPDALFFFEAGKANFAPLLQIWLCCGFWPFYSRSRADNDAKLLVLLRLDATYLLMPDLPVPLSRVLGKLGSTAIQAPVGPRDEICSTALQTVPRTTIAKLPIPPSNVASRPPPSPRPAWST